MQLSTDALSAPSKRFGYWQDCENNMVSKHTCKHEARLPWVKNEFHLDSNGFCFICNGVSNVDGNKRNTSYNLSRLLQTYCYMSTSSVTSYGSGLMKNAASQCLEMVLHYHNQTDSTLTVEGKITKQCPFWKKCAKADTNLNASAFQLTIFTHITKYIVKITRRLIWEFCLHVYQVLNF